MTDMTHRGIIEKALAALQAVPYEAFDIPDEAEQTRIVIRVVLDALLDYSLPYRYNQVELSVGAVEELFVEAGGSIPDEPDE